MTIYRRLRESIHTEIYSPYMGSMFVWREKGQLYLRTGSLFQASEYISSMWRLVLEDIACSKIISNDTQLILMYGLGIGGALEVFYAKFPKCKITAIEYDKTMISLFNQYNSSLQTQKEITIIHNDAQDVIFTIDQIYTIIIVDLFTNSGASPLLLNEPFVHSIQNRMKSDSRLIVNVYKDISYLQLFDKYFLRCKTVTFRESTLGIYTLRPHI